MLFDHTDTPAGRTAVTRAVVAALQAAVADSWPLGWQPADLLRLVERATDGLGRGLLADAIASDLARFAAATLAGRWPGQVADAGGAVWWPAHSDFVRARIEAAPSDATAIIGSTVRVTAWLRTLGRLPILDPLPGTATSRPSVSTGVDERTLTKIRHLLAKAEGTPYEAEAETFTAAAQKLMARHSIDAAVLAAGTRARDAPGSRRIGIDRPYEQPKASLIAVVANANRCQAIWSSELSFSTVVGFNADIDAVETLFTSLLVQATTVMTAHGKQVTVRGTSTTRSFRASFLTGFAHRIGERLKAVQAEEEDAARRRWDDPGPTERSPLPAGHAGRGCELVQILANRDQEVTAAVDDIFPALTSKRMGGAMNAAGWYAGHRAADAARLTTGAPLTAR